LEDRRGVLWIATEGGLDRFVSGDRPSFQRDVGSLGRVFDLAEDDAGRLWAATERGLFYKEETGSFAATPLVFDIIPRLFYEKNGRSLWGMVYGGGLVRIDDALGVQRYLRAERAETGPEDRTFEITDFGATGRDAIWLTTTRGELLRLDPETGHVREYLTGRREGGERALARSIHADSTLLAVGTREGLAIYDGAADRFRLYRHDPADPSSLGHDQVAALLRDRTGILWIGTGTGVDLWNERAMRFPHYRVPDERSVPAEGEFLTSIVETSSGALWIGTGGGLCVLDSTGTWTRYPGDGAVPTSLFPGADGSIWVGTDTGLEKRTLHDPGRSTLAIPIPDGGVRCLAE